MSISLEGIDKKYAFNVNLNNQISNAQKCQSSLMVQTMQFCKLTETLIFSWFVNPHVIVWYDHYVYLNDRLIRIVAM